MKRASQKLGRWGERLALWLLTLKGYRLRHRNWRGPGGELDLVMSRRGEIVFVEVKTRTTTLFGGGEAAVDREKQQHMVRAAAAYLGRFNLWEAPCRFDVVTVLRRPRFPYWRLRHMSNAFCPNLGRRF